MARGEEMIIIPIPILNHARPVYHRRRATDSKIKAPYVMPEDVRGQLKRDQPDWLKKALTKDKKQTRPDRKYRFMTWMSKRFPWAFHKQGEAE